MHLIYLDHTLQMHTCHLINSYSTYTAVFTIVLTSPAYLMTKLIEVNNLQNACLTCIEL